MIENKKSIIFKERKHTIIKKSIIFKEKKD
jgi:hypothetical protein